MAKCRFCKKEIDKSIAYSPSKGMYYCDESCYEQAQDKKKTKTTQKTHKSTKGSDREQCTDFIQNIYIEQGYNKSNIPWVLVGSQLKNILDNNPTWKYSGITYTMKYMKDIVGLNMMYETGTPLNLVEYYYNEAKEYWKECQEIKKAVEEFEFEDSVRVIKRGDSKRKVKKVEF